MSDHPRLAVGVEEVPEMMGIGRSTTYELIRTGALPSLRIGRRRLVRIADIEQFLAERMGGAA